MKTVWKYPLVITDRQSVRAPKGALPLTVQLQGGTITLWMEVDPKAPLEDHYFYVVGTGNEVPEKAMLFVGTVQMLPYVWHVFEELEEEPDEWPEDDE